MIISFVGGPHADEKWEMFSPLRDKIYVLGGDGLTRHVYHLHWQKTEKLTTAVKRVYVYTTSLP